MIGQTIQGIPCEQRSWLSARASAKTAGCIHFCRLGMDLSTFSTGFSTENVKKAPVFPRCFPLFPLSFPHFQNSRFIHGVLSCSVSVDFKGKSGLFHLFSERKSRGKIYFLQLRIRQRSPALPTGMNRTEVFHNHFSQNSPCGKVGEKGSFPQSILPDNIKRPDPMGRGV